MGFLGVKEVTKQTRRPVVFYFVVLVKVTARTPAFHVLQARHMAVVLTALDDHFFESAPKRVSSDHPRCRK